MRRLVRLAALEREDPAARMVIVKLPKAADLSALLERFGIALQATDTLVRIDRPKGCGADFARVIEGVQ